MDGFFSHQFLSLNRGKKNRMVIIEENTALFWAVMDLYNHIFATAFFRFIAPARHDPRITRNETFDEQAITSLCSEAIDFRAASEQFSQLRQLSEKDLETLEILVNYQWKRVPTVAGIILFGKEREKFFPDAWIQAGRFQGVDKSHILDDAAYHDHPIKAIEYAFGFVEKYSMQSVQINALRHQKSWSIPLKAVREAIKRKDLIII